MTKGRNRNQAETDKLRRRAEDRISEKHPDQPQAHAAADTQRLVHELEVHQIELEMQNAALSQSRNEVESALERYTDLYDFSPAGYFTLDRNGAIRATNLTGSSFLGIERAGLIGQPFALFVATDSRQIFSRFLSRLFLTAGETSCELTLTKKGQSPIIAQLAALASESGQECRVAIIDITKRKQAEEALLVSEKIYRAIGESINYGIWICAPDGRNIYASQSFLDLVGISQEQCSNFGWGNVLHPDDAERTIAAWKECVRTEGVWDIEHRFRGVDGQWHDILARGLPVRNERGGIIYWSGINLDISQLKKTEKALRQSEERLALATSASRVGIFEWNLTGNTILWTRTHEEIFGYATTTTTTTTAEEHDYRTWADRVHPEDLRRVEEESSRCLQDKLLLEVQYRIIRPDGSLHWVETKGVFLDDCEGKACRLLGVATDITERKRIEDALILKNSELEASKRQAEDKRRRLDAVMESLPVGVAITNVLGGTIQTNGAFEQIWAGPRPETRSLDDYSAYKAWWADTDTPVEPEEWASALAVRTGETVAGQLLKILRFDGSTVFVINSASPVRDSDGTVVGCAVAIQDISELKQVEEELRESEKRHRVLAETMLQGVVHQDASGLIISMNPAAERILGKSREDFLGNNSIDVEHDTIRENGDIFPGEEHPSMVALRTGLPVRGVVMGVFNPRLKELRWIGIDAVPVFRTGENLPSEVYAIFGDITERKQSELQIRRYLEELQSLNDELAIFNNAAVGRELRMIELKKEINELCAQTGRPPRYPLEFLKE